MRVSELSERAGVPLPTIKFYIREGLLEAGRATGKNQAEYSDEHLARLALIRSLREDAGLGVGAIARALRAADETKGESQHDFVVAAVDAIERPAGPSVSERSAAFVEARDTILRLVGERGWKVELHDKSLADAARALAVAKRAFTYGKPAGLEVYAKAVELLAEHEVPEGWVPADAPDSALHYAVLGTVLFEPFLLALRRLAHVSRSRLLEAERSRATAARTRRGAQQRAGSEPTSKVKRAAKDEERSRASRKAGAPSTSRSSAHVATREESREAEIYRVVSAIPRGKVLTYGQVAELAGLPAGHRVVASAMRGCPEGLPWQRVTGKKDARRATVAIQDPEHATLQRRLLEHEGVRFDAQGLISLRDHGWLPGDQPQQASGKAGRARTPR